MNWNSLPERFSTDQNPAREFVLVIDAMSTAQAPSGLLFQEKEGTLTQVYAGRGTYSSQDTKKGQAFLSAADPTKVKWQDEHDCFRVVGDFFRFNFSQAAADQNFLGTLQQTIGARINPNGKNCPHPIPPRPVQYKVSCKAQ